MKMYFKFETDAKLTGKYQIHVALITFCVLATTIMK